MDASKSGAHLTPDKPLKVGPELASVADVDAARKKAKTASSRAGHSALIGQTLDRFRIDSLIGVGGMSAVYRAHDAALSRTVALKLLHPHLCFDRASLERFIQEARTEGAVRHPNIVSVISVGTTQDNRLYLVMDYLEGKSLDDVLTLGGPVPQNQARNIFVQLCDALQAAHAMGVIHRDLKPSNVMLVGPNLSIVKIVDFGIAKLLQGDQPAGQDVTNGGIIGSPPYMSPEQCLGKTPDNRSDIYSLGCLMYETLTGKLPFKGDSNYALVYQHLNSPPPSFAEAVPQLQISPDLEAVVLKAMAKMPENRFDDASAMKSAISRLNLGAVDETQPSLADKVRQSTPEPAHSQRSSGRKKAIALSIVCGLAITGVAIGMNLNPIKIAVMAPGLEKRWTEMNQQYGDWSRESMFTALELAELYWQSGQSGRAIEIYRPALDAVTKSPTTYGLTVDQESSLIERAAANNTQEHQQALITLGSQYQRIGDAERAEKLLAASVDLPNAIPYLQLQTLIELSDSTSRRRDYAAEQRYVEQAFHIIEADKREASNIALSLLYLKRAECDKMNGKHDSAAEWTKRATELMPRTQRLDLLRLGELHVDIAQCLFQSQRDGDAIANLSEAVAFYSKANPPALAKVGECYRMIGDHFVTTHNYEQAVPYFEKIVRLGAKAAPDAALIAKESIATCYIMRGDFASALPLQQELVKQFSARPDLAPHLPYAKTQLSQCLAAAKKTSLPR